MSHEARHHEDDLAPCETCGNPYAHPLRIRIDLEPDRERIFDCFECAIHALAPRCVHCSCRVIGHGLDVEGRIYCCPHCIRQARSEDRLETGSFPASDAPSTAGSFVGGPAPRELRRSEGRVGWILLWALGVPIPVLLGLYFLRGCT